MENINERILSVCFKIAKRGEGALIVLGEAEYSPLVKQDVPPFNIIENPKLLESLALMDGACIIDKFGILQAYGVMLKVNKLEILKNLGTRHNSGINASMKEGNKVYVVSEEEQKIRVYVLGKKILEIDALTKDIEKKIPEVSKMVESVGWGALSGFAVPILGIVAIPGITIFVAVTGITYFLKKAKENGFIK